MNENIDLAEILRDCPIDTKFYCSLYGEVLFRGIIVDSYNNYLIEVYVMVLNSSITFTHGRECVLFPSKDQRDWSKFTAPWYKKDKFDPKTLKPFDRVLVKTYPNMRWNCDLFSAMLDPNDWIFPYIGFNGKYKRCIPLNDATKHLIGTNDEAPEYYRYWEG